jgi:hypothetical protein
LAKDVWQTGKNFGLFLALTLFLVKLNGFFASGEKKFGEIDPECISDLDKLNLANGVWQTGNNFGVILALTLLVKLNGFFASGEKNW